MVGDTPFDAQAATGCGVKAVGVLTGGFEDHELRSAGCCTAVFSSLRQLRHWAERPADAAVGASSREPGRAAVRRGNSAANPALAVSSKRGLPWP